MSARIFPSEPRIESTAFACDMLAHLPTAEKDIARNLNAFGFAVIDFPDPEIVARIERIKTNLSPRFDVPFDDPAADMTRAERRIPHAWEFDDVRAIAANAQVLELLTRLYRRRAFPFQSLNFPVGTQQAAHSDWVHFSNLPERFTYGVWLAIEDIAPEAGPVFYVPGPLRWSIVSNAMIGRRDFSSESHSAQSPLANAWRAMCKANGVQEVPFIARKGQALIWCASQLHGGCKLSDRTRSRWPQVTHYFVDDCIYYTPAFSNEALGRLATRNPRDTTDGQPRPNSYLRERLIEEASAAKDLPRRSVFGKFVAYLPNRQA